MLSSFATLRGHVRAAWQHAKRNIDAMQLDVREDT